jgi:hypothetical protein
VTRRDSMTTLTGGETTPGRKKGGEDTNWDDDNVDSTSINGR